MSLSDTESSFLTPFHRPPVDPHHQLIYADWLEERGDPRARVLRLGLVLRFTPLDNVERFARESAYSAARELVDDDEWLSLVHPKLDWHQQPCRCIRGPRPKGQPPFVPPLHCEWQDTQSGGWQRLEKLVEDAVRDGRQTFDPLRDMSLEERCDVITLPPTIEKLTKVTEFSLCGSNLIRIPVEIAGMRSLKKFTPYTSYRLHWFPYEITRCANLEDSTISTRALFGNYKSRATFPELRPALSRVSTAVLDAMRSIPEWNPAPNRTCSVCDRTFSDRQEHRVWISRGIGTDVVPLLVNACSQQCIDNLPKPPDGYVAQPHRGGASVVQPAKR